MSSTWTLLLQKGLLALSLAAALVLLCALARRRLSAYEEQSRARNTLLYEMLANVSEGLDRIGAGLDDIAARAATAKSKLGQLTAARRQNLLACNLLRKRSQQQQQRTTMKSITKTERRQSQMVTTKMESRMSSRVRA